MELLIAMSRALARTAGWQACQALHLAGIPAEQQEGVEPLATLQKLLDMPSCQLSAAHVPQLVQVRICKSLLNRGIKHWTSHLRSSSKLHSPAAVACPWASFI